jgi:hypothetical protein
LRSPCLSVYLSYQTVHLPCKVQLLPNWSLHLNQNLHNMKVRIKGRKLDLSIFSSHIITWPLNHYYSKMVNLISVELCTQLMHHMKIYKKESCSHLTLPYS